MCSTELGKPFSRSRHPKTTRLKEASPSVQMPRSPATPAAGRKTDRVAMKTLSRRTRRTRRNHTEVNLKSIKFPAASPFPSRCPSELSGANLLDGRENQGQSRRLTCTAAFVLPPPNAEDAHDREKKCGRFGGGGSGSRDVAERKRGRTVERINGAADIQTNH